MSKLAAIVRDWDYLRKWLVLGALIGLVAGGAAIVFIIALESSSKLLLETGDIVVVVAPAGEEASIRTLFSGT